MKCHELLQSSILMHHLLLPRSWRCLYLDTFDITQYYLSSVIQIWSVSFRHHLDFKFKSLLRLMPLTIPVSNIPYGRLYNINLDLDLDLDLEMSFRCDVKKYRKIYGDG